MLLIQVVAALLLLTGSAVIFKALIEVDRRVSSRRASAPRRFQSAALRPSYRQEHEDLPRAA